MIEVADSNAVYYYHFDALGSVVALSDSSGDTVQTYEYSVFGQVAAEYEDFPNPYMFAGRRFDIEIGLYYNRARYYNPFTGRFLQADPIGYEDGMNLYAYCGNSPLNFVDPSGLIRIAFYDPTYEVYDANGNFAETSQMEAWADDSYFTLHIPMLSSQDVLDALKGLSLKYNITEVFFFDHSVGTGDPNQYGRLDGLQFGDETLWFDDGTMEKFFTDMRDILGTGVTYHSRHCDLGMDINADRLMSLAMWSEGTVTGANGHIWSRIFPRADGSWPDSVIMNPITGAIVDLPDYDPHTGYTQVTRAKNGTYVRSPYSQPVNRFWGRPELTY